VLVEAKTVSVAAKVVVLGLALAEFVLLTGCEQTPTDPNQPTGSRPTATPELTRLTEGAREWPLEIALERLDEPASATSAAVRILWLSDAYAPCAPQELTDRQFERLRVRKLDDERWALGLVDDASTDRLQAPVLIHADGTVERLAEGIAEELLILEVAQEPEVYPHVLIWPGRVALLEESIEPALQLDPNQPVRFHPDVQRGFPYVALRSLHDGEEVARYRWEPYEYMFEGPAMDDLPEPPGGTFQLDMEASVRLIPYGGKLPPPKPIPEVPEQPLDMPMYDSELLPA
jgi:hypothetical protein